jgi:uncharacterized membrane protein YgdD (TMEM256/DUF423 family)
MNASAKLFLVSGAAFALAAVLLGAFGAHALKDYLASELTPVYHTAVEYQFYHALGLLAVGILAKSMPESVSLRWSGALMIAGIILFSGSLYAFCLTGVRWLGVVTPVGGLAFIAAWACLIFAVAKIRPA